MGRDRVLIVGNGLSRLLFKDAILGWQGEMWACNYAYFELGEKLTRLTGHVSVLKEAAEYRYEKGYTYQIWSGNLGACDVADKIFECPGEFLKDSGTTLVAQALHEGRKIECVGFDLGGPDVLSPNLEDQNKSSWVLRWRRLALRYTLKDVEFWGHNHKSFILGDEPVNAYAKFYRAHRPHLPERAYLELYEQTYGRPPRPPEYDHQMVVCVMTGGREDGKRVTFRRDVAERFRAKGRLRILEGAIA